MSINASNFIHNIHNNNNNKNNNNNNNNNNNKSYHHHHNNNYNYTWHHTTTHSHSLLVHAVVAITLLLIAGSNVMYCFGDDDFNASPFDSSLIHDDSDMHSTMFHTRQNGIDNNNNKNNNNKINENDNENGNEIENEKNKSKESADEKESRFYEQFGMTSKQYWARREEMTEMPKRKNQKVSPLMHKYDSDSHSHGDNNNNMNYDDPLVLKQLAALAKQAQEKQTQQREALKKVI